MKNENIFIFDVDGTLTPSRQEMTKEFKEFFEQWSKKNKFYLVTGSDLPKLQEQMCFYDIKAERIFTCCGNEMWIEKEQQYRKEFKPPQDLIDFLWDKVNNSMCPIRIGNHIEDRETMLNFSVVGRDCSQEQREEYYEWDKTSNERKNIARGIKYGWPDLDAVIGGEISIDIYKKGDDKSQTFEHIKNKHTESEFIFIGDGIENKGNDYSLAKLMDNEKNSKWYQTSGYQETQEILESLNGHNN